MSKTSTLLVFLLIAKPLAVSAIPIPPPPLELDTELEGDTLPSPIEGAFWIPSTDAESYLELREFTEIQEAFTSELLSIRVSNEAGEEQQGHIFMSNYNYGTTRHFWRSDAPLAEGVYQVAMQAMPADGEPSSLSFQLEVAASAADPVPTAGLMTSQLGEKQLDDVVTCCNLEDLESGECTPRGCQVECWTESYEYVPLIEGSYKAIAADRYEHFTVFKAELTQPDTSIVKQSNPLGYAAQVEGDAPLSLYPYEFEGEQLCVTITWENIITGEDGRTEPVCFDADEFEAIEHLTPTNEELNQAAMVCFEPPEGYPLMTEGGEPDPNPSSDQEVAVDEGGCSQRAARSSLWLIFLTLGLIASVQRRRAAVSCP